MSGLITNIPAAPQQVLEVPKDWRPSAQWDGFTGEITSEPLTTAPNFTDLLIERGHNPDEVEIVGFKATEKKVVTGVEMFRKLLDSGQAGDNIGALLRGIDKDDVERGQVLCKPGSVKPHTKFKAEAYILTKEEGGRHTPFFTNYRPQFYFRTTDVTGTIDGPQGSVACTGTHVIIDCGLHVGATSSRDEYDRTRDLGAASASPSAPRA